MIIIGIDPGTATTGWGVVKVKGQNPRAKKRFEYLKHGIISTSNELAPTQRLKRLHLDLSKLLREYKPEVLAVENVYFFKNLKTAMPVSQAKGVVLLTAAKKKIPVYEFTPLEVKMVITGYGRAEKKQMQRMIKTLLNLEEIPRPDDAADALGVAICCGLKLNKGVELAVV